MIEISKVKHPYYEKNIDDWTLWRRTYEGGKLFIDNYLKKFSTRESDDDYNFRKGITYCPSFAKEAVVEIKNSVYQRFPDITRVKGPQSYMDAISGDMRGVDLRGSSMNNFVGQVLLPELLTMGRVGVYVDMPPLTGATVFKRSKVRPYLYMYAAEQMCSWSQSSLDDPNDFTKLLVREDYDTYDKELGLPSGVAKRYRYMYKNGRGTISCCFYNDIGEMVDMDGENSGVIYELNMPVIPFVIFTIEHSLLIDVAYYQIALLNLASSDMNYAIRSNFPFYVEQFDPKINSPHLKPTGDGSDTDAKSRNKEQNIGVGQGRRYPIGADQPAFIHPSAEPMTVSMEKQAQLKQEIRQLVQLSVVSLNANKQASAESKDRDNQGLEAGLSYIGLELERGERRIANFWSMYEKASEIATVNYPSEYSLKSDEDRQAEIKSLQEIRTQIPSKTFQKEVAKQITKSVLASKVPLVVLKTIEKEIDSSPALTSDCEEITKDLEMGLVDKETASKLRGYPEGVVEKANEEHAERLARIASSQMSGARGVNDASENPPKEARDEKSHSRETDTDEVPTDKTRGEGQ